MEQVYEDDFPSHFFYSPVMVPPVNLCRLWVLILNDGFSLQFFAGIPQEDTQE